jgi:uncharacterized protein YjiK
MTLLYTSLSIFILLIALVIVKRSHSAESRQRIAAARHRKESSNPLQTNTLVRTTLRAIDFTADMSGIEVDERANGFADLTDEQKKIIELAFDGYALPVVKESRRHTGATVQQRAGIPLANSVFGDLNTVDPELLTTQLRKMYANKK